MPSSYIDNVPQIIKLIQQVDPKSVLDVGVGYGKYGYLIREYVDDWRGMTQIHGIEIHKPYQPEDKSKAYDLITYGDFRDCQLPWDIYDLILLIDVLEHFTKDDAAKVLAKARRYGRKVLVATPQGFYPQGERNGNPHEEHKSGWQAEELPGMDFSNDLSIIKLMSGDA